MHFVQFILTGKDADKFLQGQLTKNTASITNNFVPTAICNLKGRVAFGLWIKKADDDFVIVLAQNLADDFVAHIKKYGAFSKMTLSKPTAIYPCVVDDLPSFCDNPKDENWADFAKLSLKIGNYWLRLETSGLFAPQELRLHQRGGVDYDKGCYLGQEIVARLWFKSTPKAWLHRITLPEQISKKIQIVCEFDGEALVVARPDELAGAQVLPLPLPDTVGRQQL